MSLLILPYSLESQALTVSSTNTIQGTAPYLTLDGVTKITKIEDLLGIKLSDGTKITPETNNSSPTNPIELPLVGQSFANVNMIIPPLTSVVNFSDLVAQGNWGDDDGDGQGPNEVTATGNITLIITDKNNQTISRSEVLTKCNAPYKVVLSSTGGSISTRYGIPNSSAFEAGSEIYYFNPNSSSNNVCAKVEFAKPSLRYDSGESPDFMWNADKGFLTQSVIPTSYGLNFPTTAANNLYFDLEITGSDQPLTWDSVSGGGITATMSNVTSTSVRVTLTGPEAKNQWGNSNPSQIIKPNLPQEFELKGRDSNGKTIVKYGFVLQTWFVNRGFTNDIPSNHAIWCSGLGYRMPQVKDLVNTDCTTELGSNCQGALPSSSGNWYSRYIGSGLFSEWGNMQYYSNADFDFVEYWANGITENSYFAVSPFDGYMYDYGDSADFNGICVTP
ncbi:hypothetical protein [Gilliamella sp. Gris1-4]|uniref:hypothetical protein n=1 Tax=Gilliamella sp. Gris1-4 TaxID=3120244 RepID=UPI0011469FA5|nr:hypothetical protein [Gilliamella apicola]